MKPKNKLRDQIENPKISWGTEMKLLIVKGPKQNQKIS